MIAEQEKRRRESNVFTPYRHPRKKHTRSHLQIPYKIEFSIKRLTVGQVLSMIKKINTKKVPDYNFITSVIIKDLLKSLNT